MAVVPNVIGGFYIETHENLSGAAVTIASPLETNDAVYGLTQPMFGVYALTAEALILLAVDCCLTGNVSGRAIVRKTIVAVLSIFGILTSGAGMALWVFTDPGFGSLSGWIFNIGTVIVGFGAIATVWTIHPPGRQDGSLLKPRPNRQIRWIYDSSLSEST